MKYVYIIVNITIYKNRILIKYDDIFIYTIHYDIKITQV